MLLGGLGVAVPQVHPGSLFGPGAPGETVEGSPPGAGAVRDPEPPLDDDERAHLEAGAHAFDTGDYYAAHDHFEALWGEPFWKGLVQAAVALHHYQVGNLAGIRGLPENVSRLLAPYRPRRYGIDVHRFLSEFEAFFAEVAAGRRPAPEDAPRLAPSGNA